MIFDPSRPVWQGTPSVPGTGWFDREGIERPLAFRKDGLSTGRPFAIVEPPCGRCGGVGGGDQWRHTGWTCYDCGGSGKRSVRDVPLYTVPELETLNTRRNKTRARKAAKRAVEVAERDKEIAANAAARAGKLASDPFYAAFKALRQTFISHDADGEIIDKTPDFLAKMWAQIQHTDLTDGQRGAVQKFMDAAKERELMRSNSHYIGEEGKRIELVAKVVMTKEIELREYQKFAASQRKFLIKLATVDHQTLTWFTSRSFAVGIMLKGTATIKKHKEFDGIKETQITNFRIKSQDWQSPFLI